MPKIKDESTKYRILMLLLEGDKRFTDLLSEIKRATLSNELKDLENYKLIERSVDKKSRPPKVTYSITKKGRETLALKAAIIIKTMEKTAALLRPISTGGINSEENLPLANSIVNEMIATNLEKK
jgi:DNA-binding HxlR family transcriptional regulator